MSDLIHLDMIERGVGWIRSFASADDYARQVYEDACRSRGREPGRWKDFRMTSDEKDTAFYDSCVNVWNEAKRTE